MAFKKIRLAGFELAFHANPRGTSVSLAYNGWLWQQIVAGVRRKRAQQLAQASAGQSPTPALMPHKASSSAASETIHAATPTASLQTQIANNTWYHTLELAPGIKTPGQFDHAPLLDRYRLPHSLAGLRVLDVATFDGFWAFEFERRGTREVIALDLDKPVQLDFPPKVLAQATAEDHAQKFGKGFEIAKAALQSKVQRVTCSVYDLTPERYGLFDVVHAGDFLIHLNSPVRALQNIAAVCQGYALISDVYSPELDRPGAGLLLEYKGGAQDVSWWRFSLDALEQMILDAGFSKVERLAVLKYGPRGMPQNMHHVVFKAIK